MLESAGNDIWRNPLPAEQVRRKNIGCLFHVYTRQPSCESNSVHRFQVAPDFRIAVECQSELDCRFRLDRSAFRYDLTYKFGRTFASSRELGLRQSDLFQPFL